ncbi:MAG: hypothetical protein LBD30_03750, partial [Verrucomicrobiales bacterium]|nr:hypothetical protein [Verrucomicrobiales bacterium]
MKIWLGIIASLFAAARVTVSAVYYIDPAEGDDSNSGVRGSPWRGFAPLEKITLSAGDRVEIARAGELRDTLALTGTGSAQMPVVVRFAPGRYDWFPEKLLARKLAISNANDDPNGEKAIAMELKNLAWVRIEGEGAVFFCRGKMMQVHLENARDIVLSGFGFDYQRPTVSECKVESLSASDAVLAVHSDSTYVVENGKVVWVGEGWRTEADNYWQVFDPRHNAVRRCRSPLGGADVEEIAPGKLRVRFEKNPGFADGQVYQQRDVRRDYASVFCERSERIEWRGVKFYFMHGMGVVSQFSRDLSFHNVEIAPRAESGRTCAAWADMLHFSGCGGKITVDGARFFGANDDAINIHGTHLRIVETAATGRVKARFMHPQTFGFPAFADGDRVAFVNSKTLRPYAETTVSEAKMLGDREMALTLSDPLPDNIAADDVLENVTWTPSAEIKNCTVEAIP